MLNGREILRTSTAQDTLEPGWESTVSAEIGGKSDLTVQLYDADVASDDYVGEVRFSDLPALFEGQGYDGRPESQVIHRLSFTIRRTHVEYRQRGGEGPIETKPAAGRPPATREERPWHRYGWLAICNGAEGSIRAAEGRGR